MYTHEVNGVALPPLYSRLLALLSLQSVCSLRFPSLRLTYCPPFSCTAFHQSNPSVGSFSLPTSSTALVFTLPSHRSHLFACPDVPPSPVPPSTSPTPQLDHFLCLCPPPQSSSPFHRFVSHLFACPDVPPFSSPTSSAALVFTLPSCYVTTER